MPQFSPARADGSVSENPLLTTECADALVRRLVEASLSPFALMAVEKVDPGAVQGIWKDFHGHVQSVVTYCHDEAMAGPLLEESFIRGLHAKLFPGGKTLPQTLADGRILELMPGSYRTLPCSCKIVLVPGLKVWFLAPEKVPGAMESLVQQFNDAVPWKMSLEKAQALRLGFFSEFMQIHPFPDGNLRTALLLVDLLAVKDGHPPLYLSRYRAADPKGFQAALERSQRAHRPSPLQKYLDTVDSQHPGIGAPDPRVPLESK
jgi:hypothetical protein